MVLTIVPVLRALKALNAKLTLTNVRLDLVFINVPLIPFVSINLDGNYKHDKYFRKFSKIFSFRHYCECRPGFRAYQDPVVGGATICIDENECDLGTHTCHPTAQCWNTGGSYQCYCGSNNDQCSTSKFFWVPLNRANHAIFKF